MKKVPPRTDTDFRIAFAQSWNLAVAMVARSPSKLDEVMKERLEEWQVYFYKKLVDEPLTEDINNQLKATKSTDAKVEHDIQYQGEADLEASK